MSGILLDTCALIWMVEDTPIDAGAAKAMNDAFGSGMPVFVSPMSAWERALLIAKSRLRSPISPRQWFDRAVAAGQLRLAPLSPDILADSILLPPPLHRDPVDRIIIATARAYDLTIITRDRLILDYADRGNVLAIAC